MQDLALSAMDKSHAAHIGGEVINFIKCLISGESQGLPAGVFFSKIENEKFVSGGRAELRVLQINTTDPIAVLPQMVNQMMTDEAARTSNNSFFTDIVHETIACEYTQIDLRQEPAFSKVPNCTLRFTSFGAPTCG